MHCAHVFLFITILLFLSSCFSYQWISRPKSRYPNNFLEGWRNLKYSCTAPAPTKEKAVFIKYHVLTSALLLHLFLQRLLPLFPTSLLCLILKYLPCLRVQLRIELCLARESGSPSWVSRTCARLRPRESIPGPLYNHVPSSCRYHPSQTFICCTSLCDGRSPPNCRRNLGGTYHSVWPLPVWDCPSWAPPSNGWQQKRHI